MLKIKITVKGELCCIQAYAEIGGRPHIMSALGRQLRLLSWLSVGRK